MLKNKNNNAKSTIIVCLTGAVMLMGVLTGIMVIESGSAESGGAHAAKGLTAHDPIYINGNANFTAANGVTNGSGTAADPYIIENWDINASSANGIDVRNTDAYFTIRNCELHDGGGIYHGIYFNNVTNGEIQNITAYNCHHGIYLITSSNNTISVCNIYKDTMGIELYSNSNDNIISGCDIHDTGPGTGTDGIQIYENSERNIIRDCTIYNSTDDGIELSSASNNEIINCTIYNCTYQGIYLASSSDNSIINCTINDTSSDGIYLYGSSNNQITNCTITNSGASDFYFSSTSYITTLNTTFTKTKVYFGDASSTLTVKYYLHIKVTNSTSSPISGATVRVTDNANGTFDQNYTTGSDGWVRWIECTEYWQNQTSTIYYTPHNIASSKTGYTANYTEASMGESKEVVVVLSEVGLIGCWHFDGDGKNECNGPNATAVGSACFNSTGGKLGGYAYMNSSADYIKIPYDSMFDLPDNFTIEFWFRQRENRSFLQDLIYKGSATNNYNFRIFRQLWNEYNYGPIIAGFTSSATGYWNQVSNPNQLAHNTWHYVTYTKNTSGHAYYLDGTLIHSSSTTDPAVTPSYDIIIGDSAVDTDIDEVRIYNKALNASEVLAHYQEYAVNNPPNPPTLISPANNTWINDNTPLFDWVFSDPDAGGTQGGFHVQVDNASDFSSVNYEYNGSTNITTYWQFPKGTGYTTIPDGTWYWRVKAKDNNDTWGSWSGWNVTKIDTTPPTLNSIVISDTDTGNTAWTNSLTVTLWVSATDTYSGMGTGGGMCFKNEAGGTWSAWETYSSSKTWNLASGPDGTRTVYFKAQDAAGNENTSAINDPIILDTVAPYPHDPIYINGNSNFTSANGVSSGNGTAGNPYIIENWDINASSANGTDIRNTTAYFIIRNCVIHDGKSSYKYGIYFCNVTNGKIDCVFSYNNYRGIRYLYSSSNNITNCTVYNSSVEGIYLWSSSNNTIANCNVYNNFGSGLYTYSSSNNNQITNCTFYNNGVGIILIDSSNNNQITNCKFYNNGGGILLSSFANNNTVTDCTVYNNSQYGIRLDSSLNNYITNCAYNNSWVGIYLSYSSNNNQITNCTVYNNSFLGIEMHSSSNNTISACNLYNNSKNATGFSSSNTILINCTIANSGNYDFNLSSGSTVTVINTIFTETKVYFDDALSTLTVKWYLHTKVLNSTSNPISGAIVRVMDNANGTFNQNYTTASDGWVRWIECTEYWQNQSSMVYYMPHNITASKTGYATNYSEVNMDSNKELTITLSLAGANNPPNSPTLIAPANNTWTNDNTPYFDWSFSDPDAGDTQNAFNLTISKNSDFSTVDYWSNMTDSNTYYNWPSTLSDGIWYWRVKTKDSNGAWGDWSAVWILKIDTVKPESSVSPISPYWNTTGTVKITVTATDTTSGMKNASLYYRYSPDNSSWDWWTFFSTDSEQPYVFYFNMPSGDGYYEFYSIAADNADNIEDAPATADAICGYDSTAPSSSVSPFSTYWFNQTSVSVTASASDNGSGVANVSLYYRYSADNVTWGALILFGTDTVAPWEWTFSFLDGNGYYQFYSIAIDNTGNVESAPAVADAICGYDTTSPSVISTTPLNLATDVSIGQSIIVQFSEEMNTSSVQYTCLPNPGGWSASWNAAKDKLTLSHNAFGQGTMYIFNVTGKDLAGNNLMEWYVLEFTTGTGLFAVVNTPNGGEIWAGGTTHCINYTITGGTAPYTVQLYYTANDELTYDFIGFDNRTTEGNCSYLWLIPSIDSSGVRIRVNVTDNASLAASDKSNDVFTIDSTPPTSCINPLPTYWNVTLYNYYSGCIFLEWAHSEGSEPVTFKIFYKISTSDWYEWTLLDNTTTYTNFTSLTEGETYYFYSVATDAAGNVETDYNLTTGDTHTTVDTSFPYSSANPISPYWHTTLPFTITATTVDINSGVSNVTLWYRYSADNVSFGNWTIFGVCEIISAKTPPPVYWDFTAPNGNGHYEFYSTATDNAGNTESAPAAADAVCGVNVADIVEPEISNVQATPDPQTSGGHVNITCTVTDNIGVSMVMVNITGPAGFTPWNVIVPNIAGTSIYYYNAAYTIIGTYSYYIWANDTSGNENISATCSFNITSLPENSWIKGCVFDNSTWMPVAGANVSVNKTGYHNYTFTDVTGYFEMRMIAGTFNLTVSVEGYYDYYEMFTISEYETVYYNISLEHIVVPPANLSVIINNNAVYTNSTSVTLTLYAENATEMCFKNETGGTWSSWEPYDTAKIWNLQSGADGIRTVYFKCRNSAGESEIVNDSIVLDTTAPTTTYIVDGTMGENNWYVSEVAITLTATDTGSSVSKIEYNIGAGWVVYTAAFNLTEGNHTLQYRAADNAGNVEIAKSEIIKVDTTPPTTTDDTSLGWQINPVKVNLAATDATSSVAYTYYKNWLMGTTEPVSYSEGTAVIIDSDGKWYVKYYSVDYAGNAEPPHTAEVWVDTISPTVTFAVDGTIGENGWYVSDATITIVAADETSGVAYIEYRIDDGEWVVYASPIVIFTDGNHTVEFRAVDNAGNIGESIIVQIKIDKTKPTVSPDLPDYTNSTIITIYLNGYDASSGMAYMCFKNGVTGTWSDWVEYADSVEWSLLAGDDGLRTVYFRVKDYAGLVSDPAVYGTTTLDTTSPPAPSLISPENKDNVLTDKPAFAWSAVADELSGLACYEIQVDNNADFSSLVWSSSPTANITTSSALLDGTYYWRVRAVDNAGNLGDWSVVWNFTIITENQPPVIESWSPEFNPTINEKESITFSIAASDINEDNLTYTWYVDGEQVTGETGTTYTFVSDYDSAGTYNVNVTVSDGAYSDYHEWTLTVNNVNRPPFIQSYNPASDPTINETEYIELNITPSDFDAGDTLTLQWYLNETLVDTYGSYTFVSNYDSAGTYIVKVIVSDGEYNVSHEWTIIVINVNRVPVIESFSPKIYSTINETESQTFTVNASDPDGNSIGYAWYLNNTVVAGETDSSYVFTSTYGSSGVYNITVVITDNGTPMLSVNHTWALWVSNVNVPPVADFVYYEGIQVADGDYVNITLRVSGKKWQTLNMTVYADSETAGFLSIVRETGSPDNQSQSLEIMIDSSKQYKIILNYTSNGNGASPTWLTINYKNISNKMHLVFNANKNETQTRMFNLTEILDMMIRSSCLIKFESTSCDPDGDDITTYEWLFNDEYIGADMVVYHYCTTGNHSIGLTVADNEGGSDTVYRNITVLDAVEYYSSYRGLVGVELDCPADLLIVDKYNPEKIIGFTENGEVVNWVPNATVIVCGDIEIYLLPKTDYDYTVAGIGPGEYKFTVFDPGEYDPGEYGPGEYGPGEYDPGEYGPGEYDPGEYDPGEYSGKTYIIESNTSTVTVDGFVIHMDTGTVKITSNTEKYYSMIIMNGTNKFMVEEMSISSGATHSYTVEDWDMLEEANATSVKLSVDDGIFVRSFNLSTGSAGKDLLKPDLSIAEITCSNENPTEGEQVLFYVTIRNMGWGPAHDVEVTLYVDDMLIDSTSISVIWTDRTAVATLLWVAKAGNHSFRIVLDADGTVNELNENNNEYMDSISAEGKPGTAFDFTLILIAAVIIIAVVCAGAGVRMMKRRKSSGLLPSKRAVIKCSKCGETLDVTGLERPTEVICPKCGEKGTLK